MTDTTAAEIEAPEITMRGVISMQVCVPSYWRDEQITEFANRQNPTGIESCWEIRRTGNQFLAGSPERVQCDERKDCIHVMLDC